MAKNRTGKLIFFAIIISLFCVSIQGQNSDSLPELTSKRLLNDLQITVAPTQEFGNSMTIGLIVRYGAAFDPAEKGGVANLLSRMLMKAASDRTNEDLQAELDYLGATLDIQCDWDGFRFVLRGFCFLQIFVLVHLRICRILSHNNFLLCAYFLVLLFLLFCLLGLVFCIRLF